MKIGIDARLWGEKENRGLGRYVKELVLNLEKIAGDDEFFIFLTKKNFDAYQPSASNFQKRLWDVRWYSLREQISFQPLLKEKLDLVHFPHWNVPYFFNRPFIVTVHDLILLESKRLRQATTLGKTRYALKFAGFKLVLKHALKRAKKIIAISETTKRDIFHRFPSVACKIEVIYQGAPEIKPGSKEILTKFGVRPPYLLYVGSAYPHKNLEFLIKIFDIVNSEAKNKYQLALVGQEDFFYKRLKNNTESKQIVFTGHLTDSELGAFYQNAEFFINPSLIEGFGLPPLEAVILGTPAIVSDIPVFHEILGKTATYFNPRSQNDLNDQLQKILKDDRIIRVNLLEHRQRIIEKYNWQKTARAILDLYKTSAK